MPGISGKILEQKGGRDFAKVKPVSAASKIMGYTFLFLMNAGMLFYILLFVLTQTGPRQNAWVKSFALWLVVEIFMVSTAIVFFTHILIPSLVMKDLTQIKRRLMDNIRDFNEKVSAAKTNPNGLTEADDAQKISFNAANYLFVSTRLARQFPDLKESKIIAQFSTPWPRQSYLHVQNVSKGYSKKFSALTRSASILIIFFVGNFLAVPPSVQDIAVQMTSTVALGYGLFIHLQLYEIYPVLVIVPALLIAVLVHFCIQSSKADAKNKLARLFPAQKKQHCDFGPISKEIDGIDTECPAIVSEVVGEETKYNDDCSIRDGSVSSEDLEGETSLITSQYRHRHRTRRESINAGLEVLHALQQNQAVSPSDKDTSTNNSSSGEGEKTEGSDDDSERTEASNSEEEEESESEEFESASASEGESVKSGSENDSCLEEFVEYQNGLNESSLQSDDVSTIPIKDISEGPSSLCEQDANFTLYSDELHMPLGTPLSSPHIVRPKKNGRHAVMRIGEDDFSDIYDSSERSSESSSGSDDESNESDSESEYEYVYVTESEDEEQESEYETQSDSGSEPSDFETSRDGATHKQTGSENRWDSEVKDFGSASMLACPSQIKPDEEKKLFTRSAHVRAGTMFVKNQTSSCSSSAPTVVLSDESEALDNDPAQAAAQVRDYLRYDRHSSTASSVSSSSISSSNSSSSSENTKSPRDECDGQYKDVETISTMSTAEAAAALDAYRVDRFATVPSDKEAAGEVPIW